MVNNWKRIDNTTPERVLVMTKIDDADGVRNVATLAECDEFLWDCPSVQCLFGKQYQEDKKDGV